MDQNSQLVSGLSAILIALGGGFIQHGWVTSSQWELIVAGLVTGGLALWRILAKRQTAMIVSVNKADNGVKVVPLSSPTPAVNEPVELHPVKT